MLHLSSWAVLDHSGCNDHPPDLTFAVPAEGSSQTSTMESSLWSLCQQPSGTCVKLPSCTGGPPTGSKLYIPTACSTTAISNLSRLHHLSQAMQAQAQVQLRPIPSGLLHQSLTTCLPSTIQCQPYKTGSKLGYNGLVTAEQMLKSGCSLTVGICHTSTSRRASLAQAGTPSASMAITKEARHTCSFQSCQQSCNSVWPHS